MRPKNTKIGTTTSSQIRPFRGHHDVIFYLDRTLRATDREWIGKTPVEECMEFIRGRFIGETIEEMSRNTGNEVNSGGVTMVDSNQCCGRLPARTPQHDSSSLPWVESVSRCLQHLQFCRH